MHYSQMPRLCCYFINNGTGLSSYVSTATDSKSAKVRSQPILSAGHCAAAMQLNQRCAAPTFAGVKLQTCVDIAHTQFQTLHSYGDAIRCGALVWAVGVCGGR